MKSQTEKLNDDSYIPYNRPSDAADKHLDVNSFQKEAANATLDLASKGQTGKKEKPRQVSPRSSALTVLKCHFLTKISKKHLTISHILLGLG